MESIRISLKTLLKFFLYYSAGLQQHEILKLIKISKPTLIKIRKTVIKMMNLFFTANPIMLGGPLSICQVDEVKLNYNVKSHRGRGPAQQCWCFCIVHTSFTPALGYCTIVENRTSQTLLNIIYQRVLPGTTI